MAAFFDFNAEFSRTQFLIDRTFTLMASQLQIRGQKEVAELKARNEEDLVRYQKVVNRVSANKFEVTDAVTDINNALDRLIDIRGSLYEARAAAKNGDRANFDNALFNVNLKAGNASGDEANLIGWIGVDGRGTRFRTVALTEGGFNIHSRSVAATYGLSLDNGDTGSVGFKQNSITLNGETYSLGEVNYESEAGGKITFSVGEGVDQKTFTGTVTKGGLGIANSWAYGNLDSQAFRDAAFADVDAAVKTLDSVERELKFALGQAEYRLAKSTSQTSDAEKTLTDTIERHLTAEQALQRSIEVREKVSLLSFSLGAQKSLTQIDTIFRQEVETTETILDTLGLFD